MKVAFLYNTFLVNSLRTHQLIQEPLDSTNVYAPFGDFTI
jgi:hypothetical protein